jgi:hypothetical protein
MSTMTFAMTASIRDSGDSCVLVSVTAIATRSTWKFGRRASAFEKASRIQNKILHLRF